MNVSNEVWGSKKGDREPPRVAEVPRQPSRGGAEAMGRDGGAAVAPSVVSAGLDGNHLPISAEQVRHPAQAWIHANRLSGAC